MPVWLIVIVPQASAAIIPPTTGTAESTKVRVGLTQEAQHDTASLASLRSTRLSHFRDITTERLRRSVFSSVPELISAIDEYIAHHNIEPKPFIWTKSARDILQKVIRANSHLNSK